LRLNPHCRTLRLRLHRECHGGTKAGAALLVFAFGGDIADHRDCIELEYNARAEGNLRGSELDGDTRVVRSVFLLFTQFGAGHAMHNGVRIRHQIPHDARRRWHIDLLVHFYHWKRSGESVSHE